VQDEASTTPISKKRTELLYNNTMLYLKNRTASAPFVAVVHPKTFLQWITTIEAEKLGDCSVQDVTQVWHALWMKYKESVQRLPISKMMEKL